MSTSETVFLALLSFSYHRHLLSLRCLPPPANPLVRSFSRMKLSHIELHSSSPPPVYGLMWVPYFILVALNSSDWLLSSASKSTPSVHNKFRPQTRSNDVPTNTASHINPWYKQVLISYTASHPYSLPVVRRVINESRRSPTDPFRQPIDVGSDPSVWVRYESSTRLPGAVNLFVREGGEVNISLGAALQLGTQATTGAHPTVYQLVCSISLLFDLKHLVRIHLQNDTLPPPGCHRHVQTHRIPKHREGLLRNHPWIAASQTASMAAITFPPH